MRSRECLIICENGEILTKENSVRSEKNSRVYTLYFVAVDFSISFIYALNIEKLTNFLHLTSVDPEG